MTPDDVAAKAKAAFSRDLARLMRRDDISQAELARRMKTGRGVVSRMLDPSDTSITLTTMARVVTALEAQISVRVRP